MFLSKVDMTVVQYTQPESDRLRWLTARLPGSHLARDLEKVQHNAIEGVRIIVGWSRSDSDRHDPSYEKTTRLTGNYLARDLEQFEYNAIEMLSDVVNRF